MMHSTAKRKMKKQISGISSIFQLLFGVVQ